MSEHDIPGMLDGRGNVGRSEVVVSPDLNTRAPIVTLVDLRCEDNAARFMTVHLAPPVYENTDLADVDIPTFRAAMAIVEWGSGGVQHQAEIDFGVGCTFSLSCSYLRVKATLDPLINGGVSTNPVRLAASAGYGVRPGFLSGPTRTISFGVVPGGGGSPPTVVQIPVHARTGTLVTRLVSAIPLVTNRVTMVSDNATLMAQFAGTINELRDLPIPNGATAVSMTNNEAVATGYAMTFNLAL